MVTPLTPSFPFNLVCGSIQDGLQLDTTLFFLNVVPSSCSTPLNNWTGRNIFHRQPIFLFPLPRAVFSRNIPPPPLTLSSGRQPGRKDDLPFSRETSRLFSLPISIFYSPCWSRLLRNQLWLFSPPAICTFFSSTKRGLSTPFAPSFKSCLFFSFF